MGTNYYLHAEGCKCCGKADEPIHIGKSSAGWKFKLCAVEGIRDEECLAWWRDKFVGADYHMRDEYGEMVAPTEMYVIITERSSPDKPNLSVTELIQNSCTIDRKHNLLQSDIGFFVKKYIPYVTYEVVYGEFS